MPNKARSVTNDEKFHAAAVNPVKKDHHVTIRVRTMRVPWRSPHQPVGISKMA
jgi:hypothetical protein